MFAEAKAPAKKTANLKQRWPVDLPAQVAAVQPFCPRPERTLPPALPVSAAILPNARNRSARFSPPSPDWARSDYEHLSAPLGKLP